MAGPTLIAIRLGVAARVWIPTGSTTAIAFTTERKSAVRWATGARAFTIERRATAERAVIAWTLTAARRASAWCVIAARSTIASRGVVRRICKGVASTARIGNAMSKADTDEILACTLCTFLLTVIVRRAPFAV